MGLKKWVFNQWFAGPNPTRTVVGSTHVPRSSKVSTKCNSAIDHHSVFFFFFILLIVSFWLIWLRIISINLVAGYKKHEPQKVKNNLFHFFNYYSMKTAEPTNRRQNQRQNSEEFLVFSLMWISTETQVTIIFPKTKTTAVGVMSSLMSHVSSQMLTSAMWLTVQWQKCQKK